MDFKKIMMLVLVASLLVLLSKGKQAFAIEVDSKNSEIAIENVKKYDTIIAENIERSKSKYGFNAVSKDIRYRELYNLLIAGKHLTAVVKYANSNEIHLYLFPINSTLFSNNIEDNFNRIFISDIWSLPSDSKVIRLRISNNNVLLYRFNFEGGLGTDKLNFKELDINSATLFYSFEKTINKLSELVNPNLNENDRRIIAELEKQTAIQAKQKEELEKQTNYIKEEPNATNSANSAVEKLKGNDINVNNANFSKFLTLPIDFLRSVILSAQYYKYANVPRIPFPYLGNVSINGIFWFTELEPYKIVATVINGSIIFVIFKEFKKMVEDLKKGDNVGKVGDFL